ncbi:MAG: Abi family protein [Lachnospiraceae bacterium]|nr:Abi family protein [Lachnospiraceae bacterium]
MPRLKPFLNYQDQINNLITKKGLLISNPSFAEEKLQEIRYYALIDGYKSIFYDYTTRTYLPDTTFEDIVNLYDFDEELRLLIFKYICHIEQRIRSQISYYFCDKYSSNQNDYLNPNHYNYSKRNKSGINKLVQILTYNANNSSAHDYIIYQRRKYQNVPLWAVVNTLTIGQISKMYSYMQSDIQSKISHCYEAVNERELRQYLKVITDFRNVCAHNERLFLYHSHTDIPDTVLHKKLGVPKIGSSYSVGKNDLFAIVIALRCLLTKEDFKQFYKQLKTIISLYQKKSSENSTAKLLGSMGFHTNWNNILRYKP